MWVMRVCWHLAAWFGDWVDARWLPWWRRYAPTMLIAIGSGFRLADVKKGDLIFCLLAIAANVWNSHSARRNRRNGKDYRKAEAQAQLTQVQAQSFRQQVAEAR